MTTVPPSRYRFSIDDPRNVAVRESLIDTRMKNVELTLAARQKLELVAEVAQRILPPMQLRIFQAQFSLGQKPVSQRKLANELNLSVKQLKKHRVWMFEAIRSSFEAAVQKVEIERFVHFRERSSNLSIM